MKMTTLNQIFFLLIFLTIRCDILNAMELPGVNNNQKITVSRYCLRSSKNKNLTYNNNLIELPKASIKKDLKYPKQFPLETAPSKHKKQTHQKRPHITALYSCISCDKKFYNESNFTQHVKIHSPLELRIKNALEEQNIIIIQKINRMPTANLPLEQLPFDIDMQ